MQADYSFSLIAGLPTHLRFYYVKVFQPYTIPGSSTVPPDTHVIETESDRKLDHPTLAGDRTHAAGLQGRAEPRDTTPETRGT